MVLTSSLRSRYETEALGLSVAAHPPRVLACPPTSTYMGFDSHCSQPRTNELKRFPSKVVLRYKVTTNI